MKGLQGKKSVQRAWSWQQRHDFIQDDRDAATKTLGPASCRMVLRGTAVYFMGPVGPEAWNRIPIG